MTDYQVTEKNLTILRDYIEVKEDFVPNMADYGGIDGRKKKFLKLNEVNECGTSCCALGIAPSINGLEIASEDFAVVINISEIGMEECFNYAKYSKRIFPLLHLFSIGNRGTGSKYFVNKAWMYIFDNRNPNDRDLLLERMNYVLENNLEAPKSYKV